MDRSPSLPTKLFPKRIRSGAEIRYILKVTVASFKEDLAMGLPRRVAMDYAIAWLKGALTCTVLGKHKIVGRYTDSHGTTIHCGRCSGSWSI